ncbi:TOBE domain-containing protein [Aquimarina algicola]|uniref:Tobe domain protein n=1 Tax=Aquimarina algicola TaxID=2589995 RepID=A0A504J8Z2_9FLAO|nr:TOBE domain-containing protein [Aquimarina algicola]TPN84033.1 tobe domain protein [Aquimarina algicola]
MNSLSGQISNIEVSGSLSLVSIQIKDTTFKAIVIENPNTSLYLKVDKPVKIFFKETEVIITTTKIDMISLENQISGIVTTFEKGKLLTKITIDTYLGVINSIITSASFKKLGIKEGSNVITMIKTNEVVLGK